ncbi:MAG: type II toxin-antitoxin system RelE/ParE family toxin [Bacteroidaceae bacterium]|nr:type II toxin-antitoxin system RelE/ParE family toxin [Bacteroidaceae bacterium]
MKIRWSLHAYDSLSDVLDYSGEAFGYLQKMVMEEIIITSITKLADFPKMCPVIPEISNDVREYRKMVVTKEISVVYWLDDENVNISFVWDTRRSLHNIFNIIKND